MSKTIGGSFIIDDIDFNRVVTPEDFTEEQRMIGQTTEDFVAGEVVPHEEEVEKLNYALSVSLLRKAGELGLLGADVPEAYGGLSLDKISSTLINEKLTKASSFALTLGAHVGIGTLPIVYFGNEEQKRRYLPPLASGEKIAAYCLTEPSSGSDALGAKTTAVLSEDGTHYVLNGTKQFITNAGFADVFIVYAKVNGTDFSTFIVERTMEGVSIGPEEKKMGIKGSSTCPLILEDVQVPAENLLWEVGKGHLIAFNILNIGRFKLAAGCLGASKDAIEYASKYANGRSQFGRKISSFPLIGAKLADMNIRTFVLESMVYRTAGLFDEGLAEVGHGSENAGYQSAKAIAEYALECSINKVFGSETLDFVADEGVQIHGGYGFIQEYRIERIYRDSRINRIFEGTNEINRLLIPGTLIKRAMKGELPLMQKAMALQSDLLSLVPGQLFEGALEQETHLLAMAKKGVPYGRRRSCSEVSNEAGARTGNTKRFGRHHDRSLRHGKRAAAREEADGPLGGSEVPACCGDDNRVRPRIVRSDRSAGETIARGYGVRRYAAYPVVRAEEAGAPNGGRQHRTETFHRFSRDRSREICALIPTS